MSRMDLWNERPLVRGPYHIFDDSVIVEFLDTSGIDASVLIRTTFKAGHALNDTGKKHPISPPLHVHFDQSESFKVLQGKFGVTTGYEQKDTILTPDQDALVVTPMLPHHPWPVPNTKEDSVVLMWSYPSATPQPLDTAFFENIFLYLDDVRNTKRMPDLMQMMLTERVTASTAVILPGSSWLGSFRWWIPWLVQGCLATLATWLGYKPIIAKYQKKQ